jgi:apolipoprotein D and lipocalin family protein
MKWLALIASVFSTSAQAAPVRDVSVPLAAVETVDINRYLGLWYEIARFPIRFEAGCVGVTAEYGLLADGRISVLNSCVQGSLDGPKRVAKGTAKVVGPGKLKVNFVKWLPFAVGDYWIIHLEPDYSMAVVGTPGAKYGWVLARKPHLGDVVWQRALAALKLNGYDTDQLEMVEQAK